MNISKSHNPNTANTPLSYDDIIWRIGQKLDRQKRPIYQELASVITEEILSERIQAGQKLPPYRILSWKLSLSPETIQKAYRALERQCLIIGYVGDGSYVLRTDKNKNHRFRNAPNAISSAVNLSHASIIDLSRNQSLLSDKMSMWRDFTDISDIDDNALFNLLNYTDEQGLQTHREAGVKWLSFVGAKTKPDQIICTNGSQHGLQLILNALLRPHDTVAVDEYTYPGLLSLAKRFQINIIPVAMDNKGICPNDVSQQFKQYRFSALFVMPTLHNPTNIHMPSERRDEIANFCEKHKIIIIEDETQGILCPEPTGSFFDRLPSQTIILSSVSKALSSGLRVGYMAVPRRMISTFKNMIQETCWMATPLVHELAKGGIMSGYAQDCLAITRAEILRRKAFLSKVMEDVRHATLSYSPHYWIEITAKKNDTEIVTALEKRGVKTSPSAQFCGRAIQQRYFIRTCVTAYCTDRALIEAYGEIKKLLSSGR